MASTIPIHDVNVIEGKQGRLAWPWRQYLLGFEAQAPVTFSGLPTTPTIGDEAVITDSNTVVFRAIAAGGGATIVKVWWDGTNWLVNG